MNTTTINQHHNKSDLRSTVKKLIQAGLTDEQANIYIDALVEVVEQHSATKAEVNNVDHRVDRVEIKLDYMNSKMNAIIYILLTVGAVIIAGLGYIGNILVDYLPLIAKLTEVK